MPTPINLTGRKFGRLTAVSYTRIELSTGRKMAAWQCRCDCGNDTTVQAHHLRGGKSKSCGCLSVEMTTARCRTHGASWGSKTQQHEYLVWKTMINRCHLLSSVSYRLYGGRGISVCDRWRFGEDGKPGYQCFIDDMGRRPTDGPRMSIERIDNYGNYEPNNCKWATDSEQNKNRRPFGRKALAA